MKHALVALLIAFSSIAATAQRDIFWADGGMCLAKLLPGASVTYNYNVARFLGLGAGTQLYDFHATMTNFQFVPTVYWDVRANICSRKKNQFCIFIDAGLNIYKRNSRYWTDGNNEDVVRYDNGSYTGLGIGYFRPQTAKGWGHYVTLKMISNHYHVNAYNTITGDRTDEGWGDATFVVSFGYKF